ncbi:sodium-dependent multivitamin transporter isoform X2, partial [Biomphalaria glabrata]
SRNLPVLPVAMSLGASFTSATTILGIPAEVYLRGGEQWIWALGLIPCFLIASFFIVPIFYKLHLTNAYE